jgi:CelD/BcsL family acetyltransferase involved in cellulose biosynthesis
MQNRLSHVTLRWVNSFDQFAAMRPAWNALVERSARRSVFLRHEWFDAAWQWQGASSEIRLLCAYAGDVLMGVLPLVLQRVRAGASTIRTLSFLTVPDTQLCDAIIAADARDTAPSALAEGLWAARAEWDVLRLAYLPTESVAAGPLLAVLEKKGLRTITADATGNPFVPLDTSWDAYYATRTRSLKKANNLAANRLKKAGEVKIERIAPGSAEETERFLNTCIAISARSWKTRTGNSLDNPGPQAFIHRLSQLAREQGWLSVWLLSLDGVPFAMEYQLVADGDVFALRSDFDASRDDISPGSYLSRVLLEQLFSECKGRYYMGPGENAYKYRWTEQVAPMFQMTVYGSSLAGRLMAGWELALKPMARRVRERLRPAPAPEQPAPVAD